MMRLRISLLSFAITAAWAAEFETGQAARLVIGQPSFTAERPLSSRENLGAAGGVALAGNRLLILDSSRIGAGPVNHRLLIYENLSGLVLPLDAALPQGSLCPACVGSPTTVLGQPDFEKTTAGLEKGFNAATAVASDGVRIAVADTDNNRVLIWRTIPSVNGAPPDVVVGQPDFKTNLPRTNQTGLRGPQGVWFHDGKLIIADTHNSRVLIYNSIPGSNGARADIVLGQPDFQTRPAPDLTVSNVTPSARNMLNPVSATTSGNKLLVADLGFNRVLLFNSIPTSNSAEADLVLGQPNMTAAFANNATKDSRLCEAASKDDKGAEIFPLRCASTLSFPRFALSDGTRFFIADGGNDRVLVYNQFPTANGAAADVILGQNNAFSLTESNGAGSLRSPLALAHDGANLYVSDAFSRRILVFTPAEPMIAGDGVVNAASFAVHSQGVVTFDGAVKKDDEVTLTIVGKDYKYKAGEEDTLGSVRDALINQLNEDPRDPLVFARAAVGEGTYATGSVTFGGEIRAGDEVSIRIQNRHYTYRIQEGDTAEGLVDHFVALIRHQGRDPDAYADHAAGEATKLRFTAFAIGPNGDDINYEATVSEGAAITATTEGDYLFGGNYKQNLLLVARKPGLAGDDIDINTAVSAGAGIMVTNSGVNLNGGNDASEAPPGTQIAIFGDQLSAEDAFADLSQKELPRELAGADVYINGIRAPLYFVTRKQINAQVPFEIEGTSMNVYVRSRRPDGRIAVSIAKPVSVTRASPGLFAYPGPEPRAGAVVHAMAFSRGTVAIDAGGGTDQAVPAGVLIKISINDRDYEYTTGEGDTTDAVRDKLVERINEGSGDAEVEASPGRVGFLSARSRVTLEGKIKEADIVTITINGRNYRYTVRSTDSLTAVANRLISAINAGPGDPDVTARLSSDVGVIAIDIIARQLGSPGNEIGLSVGVSAEAQIKAAVVILTSKIPGRDGDLIRYTAAAPGGSSLTAVGQTTNLCCGNDYFAPVTPENPAVPGEIIIVFGTGLGLTSPRHGQEGLMTGSQTPDDVSFQVPAHPDDFVSSLAGGKTASVDFVGLMPGKVGVYQINLILNSDMPDDPMVRLTIAQGLFVSNIITIPVRNRAPRRSVL